MSKENVTENRIISDMFRWFITIFQGATNFENFTKLEIGNKPPKMSEIIFILFLIVKSSI